MLTVGALVAVLASLVLGALATRRMVPPPVAVLAPLLVLLVAWLDLRGVQTTIEPGELAGRLLRLAPLGLALAGSGVVLGAGGLLSTRGPAGLQPSLVQLGAVSFAMGVVWTPWFGGHAMLYEAWGLDAASVRAVQLQAIGHVRPAGLAALLALGLVWLPATLVAVRQHPARGLSNAAGTMMVVSLSVLLVGREAGRSLGAVVRPWRETCEQMEAAGVELPAGPLRVRAPGLGPPGEADVWVVPPEMSLADLPERGRLAGVDPDEEGPWLFRRHPVVATARCGAWDVEALRAAGALDRPVGDVVLGLRNAP